MLLVGFLHPHLRFCFRAQEPFPQGPKDPKPKFDSEGGFFRALAVDVPPEICPVRCHCAFLEAPGILGGCPWVAWKQLKFVDL